MAKVTPTAYAKHRRVSPAGVFDAIERGRLSLSLEKKDSGRYLVDVDLADAEWLANTDSMTGSLAHAKNRQQADERPEITVEPGEQITYAEARAQHERFKARLAELELDTREGKLVNADDAKQVAFKVARQVRDALLNLPDRVAGELAAETNQFKVHQRLTKEIRRALEELKLDV